MATDEEEYQDLTEISNEFYELEYPEQPLGQYRATLSSGNQVFVYTTPGGAEAINAEGFEIHEITDDDYVTVDASSTRYTPEQLMAQPGTVEQPAGPRRPRPKLRGRVGKHREPSPVASIDEQRSKPARGQPSTPFGYEGGGVSKLPRHRRREP